MKLETVMKKGDSGLRMISKNSITEEDRNLRLIPGSIYVVKSLDALYCHLEHQYIARDTLLLLVSGPADNIKNILRHYFRDVVNDKPVEIHAQAFYILKHVDVVYQKVEIISPFF